ncbi:unnamed protein product [Prunus armeniaca]|uniref:Uncharacterized protein n=1 Tax=Prunus armeniaca TaxID=36596 RepID=A0A6J5U3G5_PRUAR|nr:unnamed protein product [Prunus armeniaca]
MGQHGYPPATLPHYLPLVYFSDPTLPPPWTGMFDGNLGVVYYWNPQTNVSQYEHPASSSYPTTHLINSPIPQFWNSHVPLDYTTNSPHRLTTSTPTDLAAPSNVGTGSVAHPLHTSLEIPDPNSKPQSLKVLLDYATHKPRFSKREKRRKLLALRGSEAANGSVSGGNFEENKGEEDKREVGSEDLGDEKEEEKKKKKKRKRDKEEENGSLSSEENEVVKEEAKKPKKKNKKKKRKEAKNEEEKKDGELGTEERSVKETGNNSDRQANGDVPTKVFVGGIPYYSTEDDIRSYFESCGTITEVDCLRFPESGKFRGIAIISFKTEAAAKRALALDGAEMGELFLKIQPYKATQANKVSDFAPQIVEGYNRIYVENLSWDITEDDLKKLFSDCKISSIHFGTDEETGEFRGYAHVNFSDSLSLTLALKLDQKVVCGRPVKISCAVPLKRVGIPSKSAPMTLSTLSISVAPTTGANLIPVTTTTDTGADNSELSSVSGKIKRRTCYRCGEKGHLLSACPISATMFSSTHSISIATTTSTDSIPVATTRSTNSIPVATTTRTNSIPVAATTRTNSIPVATTTSTGADNGGLSAVSGKIKRRTCYRCGEKGHLLSACPISATTFSSTHSISIATTTSTDSIPVATTRSTNSIPAATTTRTNSIPVTATTRTKSIPVATTTSTGADNGGLSAVSGKIKRRTCYWCGEKGHLLSACPISATTFSGTHSISIATTTSTDSMPLATTTGTNSIPVATTTRTNLIPVATTTGTEADNVGLSAISGKIKRRTCYRCGEKGHLLSACPISATFSSTRSISIATTTSTDRYQ